MPIPWYSNAILSDKCRDLDIYMLEPSSPSESSSKLTWKKYVIQLKYMNIMWTADIWMKCHDHNNCDDHIFISQTKINNKNDHKCRSTNYWQDYKSH